MEYSSIETSNLSQSHENVVKPKTDNQPTSKPVNSIISFLNTKSGTLLTTAMGFSVGFTFRDFIKELIESIVNSVIFVVSKKSMGTVNFNIFKLSTSFIVLILIVLINYYVFKLISQ